MPNSVVAHAYSLETFFDDCRASLLADAGPDGQGAVRRHLVQLLRHPRLIDDVLGPDPAPGRRQLHHEPSTGMRVFVHVYNSAGVSKPHDHGPCWIVYGNLSGHTDMVDYRRRDDGAQPGYADLETTREYRVHAGEAELFHVGAIHETAHPDSPSILIRVVSDDMDNVWRHTFNPAKKTVTDRPPRPERD
jgi:predicted metal-dependent enzyme (double-stranded beta helix superfamily)